MDEKIEKIYEIAGTKHKYQFLIVTITFFCWFCFELLSVSLSFLEMMPYVEYPMENGTEVQTKLTYDICKGHNFTILNRTNHSWVSDFDIECDDIKTGLIGTFTFFGVMCGALIFQVIADRLGRRLAIIISSSGFIICLIIFQWANSIYYAWVVTVFMQIFSQIGNLGSYLLMNEITSITSRSFCGAIVQSAFSFSGTLFIGLYYYMDSWKYPFLVAAGIVLANLITFFLLGFESPRYLLSKNRIDEYFMTLGKIAKFNGNAEKFNDLVLANYWDIVPDSESSSQKESVTARSDKGSQHEELIKKNDLEKENKEIKEIIERIKQISSQKVENAKNNVKKVNCLALLTYKSQRVKFLIMCYMWFCTSGVYYGLTINIKNLPGNTYITGIVMFFVEAISYLLSGNLISVPFLGRKKTIFLFYSISFIIWGVIIIFGIESLWLTILSVTARFCVSAVYNIIYTYSTEVYPTVIRSNGLGYNSVCGRIGGMVFPFLLEILHDSITYVFIFLNLFALLAVLILPETFGKPLSDSLPEDLEEEERKKVSPTSI
jgi:MFS family permease